MDSKALTFIKNFSYTLSSNIISLLISTLVILIVPKVIGVKEYGYWQVYMFYASYVGFFQFGWNDGIYLRYGGKDYKHLEKSLFFSQFWMLLFSQMILAVIIGVISFIFVDDTEKQYILLMTALCMIIVGVRAMLLFILQGTNRIKEYAAITMLDRLSYCCLIAIFLVVGTRDYKFMIVADLIGKLISLIYSMYKCRDIVFREFSTFYLSFREAIDNISVGIKLMIANIASTLIIGVVRLGIENTWDVATFGKVSLTLSVSNLMMLFINAIGIIIFPILRRTEKRKLTSIYTTMSDFLMVVLLGLLVLYHPLKNILIAWLPEYADGLIYMTLVFPICIYEGKISLLINTYLKTLREEKAMLKINLVSLMLSIILTIITTVIYKNLNLAILSIVIILSFRCLFAEFYIATILKISIYKDVILELIMVLIFILTGWFLNSAIAVVVYMLAYGIYLFIKKKDISRSFSNMKLLFKS